MSATEGSGTTGGVEAVTIAPTTAEPDARVA